MLPRADLVLPRADLVLPRADLVQTSCPRDLGKGGGETLALL